MSITYCKRCLLQDMNYSQFSFYCAEIQLIAFRKYSCETNLESTCLNKNLSFAFIRIQLVNLFLSLG